MADGAGAARSLLGLDEKAPKARVPDVKWTRVPGKAPLHPSAAPLERWDEDTGEFVGQGFGSPAAILQAIHAGELLCDEPWADQFLEALGALAIPDTALWGCPLLRAVVVPPAELRGGGGGKGKGKKVKVERGAASSSAAAASSAAAPEALVVTVHVYVTRLLLYLIANPAVAGVLSRLTPPAAGGITDGVVSLPAHPRVFTSGGGAASPPFSLEGVLKSSEHGGYREAASSPKGSRSH